MMVRSVFDYVAERAEINMTVTCPLNRHMGPLPHTHTHTHIPTVRLVFVEVLLQYT